MICDLKYIDSEQFIIILTFLIMGGRGGGGRGGEAGGNVILGFVAMGKSPIPQRYIFWSYSLSQELNFSITSRHFKMLFFILSSSL